MIAAFRQSFLLIVGIVGITAVAVDAMAQIPVAINGTPAISFDAPVGSSEWATLLNGIGMAVGTYNTPAEVDAAAQTIDQNQVTSALPTTTFYGTSHAAQHNTDTSRLVTRPTGIGAVVLKANLRNTSGVPLFSIRITYDYDVAAQPAGETAEGHRVFWSPTGQTNSWKVITNFSSLNAMASVAETIQFFPPWAPDTDIYLLWLDDNAFTGPEGAYTIDNFAVTDVVHVDSFLRLNISTNPSSGALRVSWSGSGVLQETTALQSTGTVWTDVPTNSNPYIFNPTPSSARYFRLRQ